MKIEISRIKLNTKSAIVRTATRAYMQVIFNSVPSWLAFLNPAHNDSSNKFLACNFSPGVILHLLLLNPCQL